MMTAEQAKFLAGIYLGTIENEFPTTRKVLAAVPENRLDFKLGDKGKTARELMWHIAGSEAWFGEGVASGSFARAGTEPPPPETAARIVAFYEQAVPAAIAKIKAMSGEQLVQTIDFQGVFNFPAVLYLGIWHSHVVHHRGQLAAYLRAMNARVPSIYGGSADEPFEMPARDTA